MTVGIRGRLIRIDGLPIALVVYGAASLFHHVHNAAYLNDYPNMPAWLSFAGVYAAWLAVTSVGIVGFLLVHRGYRLAGLIVVAAYAGFGFDGLGHYGLAPLSAHSFMMNLSIWLEVATAAALLVTVAGLIVKQIRRAT